MSFRCFGGREKANFLLLARDRVSLLLDPESPFLELCSFAGYASPDSSPCASLVVGIGSVRFVNLFLSLEALAC